MVGKGRQGRVLNGRTAADTGSKKDDKSRRCSVCGAAPGWSCVRKTRYQYVPMKHVHPGR